MPRVLVVARAESAEESPSRSKASIGEHLDLVMVLTRCLPRARYECIGRRFTELCSALTVLTLLR